MQFVQRKRWNGIALCFPGDMQSAIHTLQRREQIVPAEPFQDLRADRKLVEAALDHIGSHRSSLFHWALHLLILFWFSKGGSSQKWGWCFAVCYGGLRLFEIFGTFEVKLRKPEHEFPCIPVTIPVVSPSLSSLVRSSEMSQSSWCRSGKALADCWVILALLCAHYRAFDNAAGKKTCRLWRRQRVRLVLRTCCWYLLLYLDVFGSGCC